MRAHRALDERRKSVERGYGGGVCEVLVAGRLSRDVPRRLADDMSRGAVASRRRCGPVALVEQRAEHRTAVPPDRDRPAGRRRTCAASTPCAGCRRHRISEMVDAQRKARRRGVVPEQSGPAVPQHRRQTRSAQRGTHRRGSETACSPTAPGAATGRASRPAASPTRIAVPYAVCRRRATSFPGGVYGARRPKRCAPTNRRAAGLAGSRRRGRHTLGAMGRGVPADATRSIQTVHQRARPLMRRRRQIRRQTRPAVGAAAGAVGVRRRLPNCARRPRAEMHTNRSDPML